MGLSVVSIKEAEKSSSENICDLLQSSSNGLSAQEVEKRQKQFGFNDIPEKRDSLLIRFLSYFWGPIPWMIECAALLAILSKDMVDFYIIFLLLFVNAVIGFVQEFQAANAVAALKERLMKTCRVRRDGQWQTERTELLVPGDIIRIRMGDVVPADVKLIQSDFVIFDQSALTGESLPVTKRKDDVAFSGAIVKQGEAEAIVVSTGINTFFGKTVSLVASSGSVSEFQRVVMNIGSYLIHLTLGLASILLIVGIERGESFLTLMKFALVLTVASIPSAMPAVLSATMAIGAVALSKLHAIVTKLTAIEELASVNILCADKTGTLTQNTLAVQTPFAMPGVDQKELLEMAALASKEENKDPLELAIFQKVSQDVFQGRTQENFLPFDPVHKKTEATIVTSSGERFIVSKGAVQVMMKMCELSSSALESTEEILKAFAEQGYRTLGVARKKEKGGWQFLGLIPFADPLRPDSRETVERAAGYGVQVKMITGDNIAIAHQVARTLGVVGPIVCAEELADSGKSGDGEIAARLMASGGVAQVYPEDKHHVVKVFQEKRNIVGMTGDGVNDAPALKQADVGIAVDGATDAARAASDLVLLKPGLSVIVQAIEETRRIFERMRNYATYRISETIRIMFFIVLAMLTYNFYPISALMIVLLAFFNDLPILCIAYDRTNFSPTPSKWQMHELLTVSTVLGFVGVVESFLFLILARSWGGLPVGQIQTMLFLKLVIAGHFTLLVVRNKGAFFRKPYPTMILTIALLGTPVIAGFLAAWGWLMAAVPWAFVGYVWIYCTIWLFIEDWAKLLLYRYAVKQAE